MTAIKDVIPVIDWLPKYNYKDLFVGDLTSGITVAVMHIPQGMAYAMLAGVPPNVGMYMAFFPTLIYFLFGTSRHISMGTFAIVSLMVSKIVQQYSHPIVQQSQIMSIDGTNLTNLTNQTLTTINAAATTTAADENFIYNAEMGSYSPIEVVTAVTIVVGVLHILMCFLRLGMLTSLLSDPLVNGFTTAAAVHVLVSQLKDLFGLHIQRYKGAFKIVYVSVKILTLRTKEVIFFTHRHFKNFLIEWSMRIKQQLLSR